MNIRTRRLASVGTALATAVLGCLAVTAPAHAATAYTWTAGIGVQGADHHSWGNPLNWSPQGVPADGDSVSISDVDQGSTQIDGIPDITLDNLTLDATDQTNATLGGNDGEHLTVSGTFTWTGGKVATGLTLPAGATGTIGAGYDKNLWGDLDVEGSLALENTSLHISWTHTIEVGAGGTFATGGAAAITNDRCCGDSSNRLVNHGTLRVEDGTLTTTGLALEQRGTLEVSGGSSMVATKGVAKLGPDATYAGGGTLSLTDTASPDPDPEHPAAYQGAALVRGDNTLVGGFVVEAGPASELTGSGSFDGQGRVQLRGATVYGDLATGSDVAVSVTGPELSAIAVWDYDQAGYAGHLSAAGEVGVEPGSRLDLDHGGQLEIRRGGDLTVPGGATLGANTCCSGSANLLSRTGSHVTLGGGSDKASLVWLTTRLGGQTTVAGAVKIVKGSLTQTGGILGGGGSLAGTLRAQGGSVNPGGSGQVGTLTLRALRMGKRAGLGFDVDGKQADRLVVSGTARLAGQVVVVGKPGPSGHRSLVVKAEHRKGKFARVSARHWRLAYGARSVTLITR